MDTNITEKTTKKPASNTIVTWANGELLEIFQAKQFEKDGEIKTTPAAVQLNRFKEEIKDPEHKYHALVKEHGMQIINGHVENYGARPGIVWN